jgi:chorismate synthase
MPFRYSTAGESHGEALVALIEGLPSHVRVTSADISAELARRRLGFGRGARMGFEQDQVKLLSGVVHGETLGSPVAIEIANTEWPKWMDVMSPDPLVGTVAETDSRHAGDRSSGVPAAAEQASGDDEQRARGRLLTRPRPGHADLAGMQKYDWTHARPILERASARETAARVAVGALAKAYLAQAFGITVLSHVVAIGEVTATAGAELPRLADLALIDASPVRCFSPSAAAAMLQRVEQAQADGDTLGGVVEIIAWGCPPGLGSHTQWDTKLDGQLAGALMSIQAIKGVEVGAGFAAAHTPGSLLHDQMVPGVGGITRLSNNAGGIEGGMSNGSPIVLRAAMKPIATVPHALASVDVATGQAATADHQRSDVCAVPAAGVVAEAMVALVLAGAAREKFGGDSLGEARRNYLSYLTQVRDQGLWSV